MNFLMMGKVYRFATGEHAFHAYKSSYSLWDAERTRQWLDSLQEASTPNAAKKLGRAVKIDVDAWDENSYEHMVEVVKAKFSHSSLLAEKLLQTQNTELVEYNSWGDKLWGVDERTRQGNNQLGVILMRRRDELRKADTVNKLF